jgi:hypothetical protein
VTLSQPVMDQRRAETLRMIIENPDLNESLWLVWHGIPFDVAMTLSDDERFAYAVIFGRFEGSKFDFGTMRFEDQK